MVKATIIREDRRFFLHKGVDLVSLYRAVYENFRYHKIVSGGSTITMQEAKIILNHKKRTIFTKILEILYALKLELHLNKAEILEIYLNRVPYGSQTYGVEAGAQFYFRKSAKQLSIGECCILAALPKSPGIINPFKNQELLNNEKSMIVNKLLKEECIDSTTYFCALKEPFQIDKKNIIFRASHFVDFVLSQTKENVHSTITSTIDISLQENLEKMLFTSIKSLKKYNVHQGAVIVMDTKTGEILALVGSKDYFDEKEGQVNGCLSLRQPGSSLKPFLYILALSNGYPISYLMNDTITEFKLADGTIFAPRNYGEKYHKLVRAREALGSSFNVPAVYLLERMGVEKFYTFLTNLHFTSLFKQPNFYGLSLSLGAAEIKLIELANAYRAIANNGIWSAFKFLKDDKKRIGERFFSEEVAYIVTDVLADNSSRIKAFGGDSPLNLPFPCAVKTGTTKNFKDNWCIGFTKKYTVGIWVGNFDGTPMNGVSGISGAAPLFRDIMIELHRNEYPAGFEEPKSLVHSKICAKTGLIAGKGCPIIEEIYIPGTEPKDTCFYCGGLTDSRKCCPYIGEMDPVGTGLVPVRNNIGGFRIIHPQNGDIFKLDPQIPYRNQAIVFKVQCDSSIESFTLHLNGKNLCENKSTYLWQPKPGKYELEARAKGRLKSYEDKVLFTVY